MYYKSMKLYHKKKKQNIYSGHLFDKSQNKTDPFASIEPKQ